MQLIYFLIIIFAASITQTSTGIGFGLVVMALLPFFVSYTTSVIIVVILMSILSMYVSIRMKGHINFKLIIPSVTAAFLGRTIGVYVLFNIDTSVLKICLGVFLILLSIYFFFFEKKIRIRVRTRNGIIAGLISGLMGGVFGIGGPPLAVYYLSATKNKEEYFSSLQISFVILALYTFVLHLVYGNVTSSVLKYSFQGLLALVPGIAIGYWIFRKWNEEIMKKAVYLFLIVIGFTMVVK